MVTGWRGGPVIAGLESSIVCHRTWWRRQWFHAEGARYYHRLHTSLSFRPGPQFYLRVDPELREICHQLHGSGLLTTPSCQGHFHDRVYFEQRWDELRREAALITRDGLPVREAATDREYLFRDPRYRLPWEGFESFYRDSLVHQSIGYLGIIIPHHEHAVYQGFRSSLPGRHTAECAFDQHARRTLNAHLLHIFVHPRDAGDGARLWRRVTDWVSDTL